jgi:hypothetical protein
MADGGFGPFGWNVNCRLHTGRPGPGGCGGGCDGGRGPRAGGEGGGARRAGEECDGGRGDGAMRAVGRGVGGRDGPGGRGVEAVAPLQQGNCGGIATPTGSERRWWWR